MVEFCLRCVKSLKKYIYIYMQKYTYVHVQSILAGVSLVLVKTQSTHTVMVPVQCPFMENHVHSTLAH